MVNENLINLINNKSVEEVREIPTYQPKYTDEEVARLKEQFIAEQKEEIKKYQTKGSPLSSAARSKVIRKWGSDYQSSRMNSEDIAIMQMYGPGFWSDFWDDVKVVVKPVATGALVVASVFPPTAAVAAPVAFGVMGAGAATMGLGHITDSEGLKEFGKDLVEIAGNGREGQGVAESPQGVKQGSLNEYARSRK